MKFILSNMFINAFVSIHKEEMHSANPKHINYSLSVYTCMLIINLFTFRHDI